MAACAERASLILLPYDDVFASLNAVFTGVLGVGTTTPACPAGATLLAASALGVAACATPTDARLPTIITAVPAAIIGRYRRQRATADPGAHW